MNNQQLNGLIEGLGYAFAGLVAELETAKLINGPQYCQALYEKSERLILDSQAHDDPDTLRSQALALNNLAVRLDEARTVRQKRTVE